MLLQFKQPLWNELQDDIFAFLRARQQDDLAFEVIEAKLRLRSSFVDVFDAYRLS